jgi:tetratricopeptide (TPR) repeat protein
MTDTYEQMTALDDWMRELARKLPKNVLLVLAGRIVPAWDRSWQDWMGKAKIVELKEMAPDDIRTLVHRYYAFIRGGEPDQKQVEAIVQFARGLPMVATTVVQLWVKYGLEDFQMVRSKVVADLVDRLLEGVPSNMRPSFESAAVLRYFNVESLNALLENGSAEALYAELRRWPFIRSRKEGLAVHDTMREMINAALKERTPKRFRTLCERAAAYHEAQMEKATGEERERHAAEQLYHHILADEESGIQLFQETAEAFVLYCFIVRLRSLLKDVETYKQELDKENSLLWLKYYSAQLTYMEGKWEEAERIYQEIEEKQQEIEEKQTERKLRAYVLCKHGWILSQLEWRRKEGSPQKAVELIQRAFSLVRLDRQLVLGHKSLSIIYEFQGDMERAEHHLQQMLQFYKEQGDAIGVAPICSDLRWHYMLRGNWKKMLEVHNTGLESIAPFPDISPVWKEKAYRVNWGHIWMGRYREYGDAHREIVENILPQIVDPLLKTIDPYLKSECLYRLAFGEGMQRRFHKAHKHFDESFAIQQELGLDRRKDFQGVFRGFWGAIYTKQGEFEEAERYLGEALAIKQEAQDSLGIPEVLLWLGELYEIRHMWGKAEDCYSQCLEEYKVSRPYFDSCALTGMVRVRYSQQQYDLISSLLNQAESLAQQNEYNDHLASLCLTKGHLVWDGHISECDSGFDTAFRCYQKALIYALRYNSFLLDETVQGNVPTALQSLIPHCMEKGKEGHRMLVALRDWWQSGTNDVGTPRADTISLVQEGIPLLEAEHIVRKPDIEDSMHQHMVIDQLDKAIHHVEKSSREDP